MNRHTEAARKIREELLVKLGGKCAICQETDPAKLEFDHIHGRDYTPNKLSYRQRMTTYRREAEKKLIRILCSDCNLAERKTHENGRHCRTNENPIRTLEMPEIVEVEI